MTDVSDVLSVTKPAVTNLADQLEKEKLISRIPHPEDRRSYLLEIQPKGIKKANQIQDVILATLDKTFAGLKKSESEIVHDFYEQLSNNLKWQFQKEPFAKFHSPNT